MMKIYDVRKLRFLISLLLVFSSFTLSLAKTPTIAFSDLDVGLSFELSPNPSRGDQIRLLIQSEESIEVLEVIIYDTIGGIVYKEQIQVENKRMDKPFLITPKEKLSPGLYFLTLKSQDKKVTKRLIIV